MKGLLIKDYYLIRKNLLITLMVCIYVMIGLFVGVGALDSTNKDIDMMLYGMCFLLPCFFTSCSLFVLEENLYNVQSLYNRSLPVMGNIIVMEKYLITYIMFFVSYVVVFFASVLCSVIGEYKLNTNALYICFLVASIVFVYMNIEIPLIVRFGQMVAAGLILFFMIVIIMGGVCVIVKTNSTLDMSKLIKAFNDKKIIISLGALLVDVLSMLGSYKLSKIILLK